MDIYETEFSFDRLFEIFISDTEDFLKIFDMQSIFLQRKFLKYLYDEHGAENFAFVVLKIYDKKCRPIGV